MGSFGWEWGRVAIVSVGEGRRFHALPFWRGLGIHERTSRADGRPPVVDGGRGRKVSWRRGGVVVDGTGACGGGRRRGQVVGSMCWRRIKRTWWSVTGIQNLQEPVNVSAPVSAVNAWQLTSSSSSNGGGTKGVDVETTGPNTSFAVEKSVRVLWAPTRRGGGGCEVEG